MTTLDKLEEKAWAMAEASVGPDDFLKAVQAAEKLRGLREERKPPVWPVIVTPLTGLLAIVIAALTFTNQVHQANTTFTEDRNAREDQQWTDTLSKISLKDAAAAQVSAFELESFFDSPRHGDQARDMASSILHLVDNNVGFEAVWKELVRHTHSAKQQSELLVVAGRVSANLRDSFAELKGRETPEGCSNEEIADFMNQIDDCFPSRNGKDTEDAKLGSLYSWEVDSTATDLVKIWHDNSKRISPAGLRLSGVILANAFKPEVNLRGVNFTNTLLDGSVIHLCDISGAHFDGAKLDGAELHQIYDFEGSTWVDANWWDAKSISSGKQCRLINFLNSTYPPKDERSREHASALSRGCEMPSPSPSQTK
jgi:Pentapeptide repeats (8 copies)